MVLRATDTIHFIVLDRVHLKHTNYSRMCPVPWSKYECAASEQTLGTSVGVWRACLPAHAWWLPRLLYNSAAHPLWSHFISPCVAANVNRQTPPPSLSCMGQLQHSHTHRIKHVCTGTREWRHSVSQNNQSWMHTHMHTHYSQTCSVGTRSVQVWPDQEHQRDYNLLLLQWLHLPPLP